MLAAKYGSIKALSALLVRNAKYSLLDYRKWTALHYASFYNQPKIVRHLVRWDFDRQFLVNAKNTQNRTPIRLTSDPKTQFAFKTIWEAAIKGDLDGARKVLNSKHQDINASTQSKRNTALILAVKNQQILMVKFLLTNKADAKHKNNSDHDAKYYAEKRNNTEIIDILKKYES